MKKLYIALIAILLLLAVSCSSTIGVSYMRPSDVDMGRYRNIAVASTVPYKGYISYPSRIRYLDSVAGALFISSSYGSSLPDRVAGYATDMIVSAFSNTGFYNILTPAKTDSFLNLNSIGYNPSEELLKAGYDAVVIPKVEKMGIDEFIWSVDDGYIIDSDGNRVRVYDYYIKRIASITLSITVIDCKTNKIIANKTYSDTIEWSDEFDPSFPFFDKDVTYLFRTMINGFKPTVLQNFVPAMVVRDITLMENKPKIESLKEAYKAVDNGNLDYGYRMFLSAWNEEHHIPSGYNAALIKSALGDYDTALDILASMKESVSSSQVDSLYRVLSSIKATNAAAEAQINGTSSSASTDNSVSIYDYLLN